MKKIKPVPEGEKHYLGDGVYISYDGYGWWLTAENGFSVKEKIYIDGPLMAENLKQMMGLNNEENSNDL